MNDEIEPKPKQIWSDAVTPSRELEILKISDGIATCRVWKNGAATNRHTEVLTNRFKPTPTGYRFSRLVG